MPLVPIKTMSLTEVLRRYPPRFPDFIPRRCGKTEAMRRMLDHPYFTHPTTISYFQKEPTMRLTKAQKAANALATANAKIEQVRRLNDELTRLNQMLRKQQAEMEQRAIKHQADMSGAAQVHATQAQHIAAFKQEVPALTTENATLRGYMARVLEDDTVREVGGAKQPEAVLDEGERRHFQRALAEDNNSRRQPPQSVRTGPFPPMIITGCDMAADWNPSQWDRAMRKAPAEPKHWLQR